MTSSPVAAAQAPIPERMHCMEVWGGNQETHKHFELAGLDVWVMSQPYKDADGGGDVYYLSSCASGRITRILLADVSGHGVEAAELGVELRNLMRQNINVIKQTRFVRRMNEQFSQLAEADRFATAVVCSYFSPTRIMEISSAGHPQPLLYRKQEHCWTLLEQTGTTTSNVHDLPLGVIDDARYSQIEVRLNPGDCVLLYSDALSESCDAVGHPLGTQGVLNAVRAVDISHPDVVIPALCESIRKMQVGNLAGDDVTVFLIRASGSASSLKDNLLAPFRLLRQANDRTRLSHEI